MKTFTKDTYGKILIPMVTPFDTEDNLDYVKLFNVAQHLIDENKADSLILTGTTGEFHTMTTDERIEVFQAVKTEFGEKIPLIAGVGGTSTKETVRLARSAQDLGFESAMVVAPYYTKPNQRELYEHYYTIAEATDINLILYNIPIFTGVNLDPETVKRLSEHPRIVALKEEAELNPKQMTAYLNCTPSDFIIYNGDDTMILEAYAQGGRDRIGGVISGASHIVGPMIRSMIERFLSGDIDASAQMQRSLFPLLRIMGQNNRTNPVALLKETMRLLGIDAGIPRKPLLPGTSEEIDNIRLVLNELRIGLKAHDE